MSRGDFDYEAGGAGYGTQRRADPRIEALVHEALGDARTVVNVGAGAGSYEPAGRTVLAVEPSASMRAQRKPGSAPVVEAVAAALPVRTDAVDAAMAMITVHQWPDPAAGLRELRRVARRRAVVLTFDRDELGRFWLVDYLPELIASEQRRFPTVTAICDALGPRSEVTDVPIPIDCTDGFIEAYYARPEQLLNPSVRASQSAWGHVSPDAVRRFVTALRADLDSGRWDERYGHLRRRPQYTGSLRLVTTHLPG